MNRRAVTAGLAIVGLAVTALAGPAMGGEPRTHDGLFLRLSGGGGHAQTKLETSGESLELSGGTGDLNVAIGAVVGSNLAIHGTLFGWLISDPDAELAVDSLGTAEGTADGDLDLTGFGGGLTYYFMPVNIYISGSAGFGMLSFDSGDFDVESDNGFLGEITIGKEWWVGGSWGLGVAGAFGFHSIPDGDIDENWSGTSYAIRLSATMN